MKMRELTFDCTGIDIAFAHVTDFKRRPIADSRVVRDGNSLVVKLSGDIPMSLQIAVNVGGFGRVACTADQRGNGYVEPGEFLLLRELALSHQCRAERTASTWQVNEPIELVQSREKSAKSAWQDTTSNLMASLASALIAGEEIARASAERILDQRIQKGSEGPLVSATLFGERLEQWSIGVGPDWEPTQAAPDFALQLEHQKYVAALCNATTLPNFLRWIEPQRGKPRWEVLDTLVEFCEQNDLRMKSFALYWGGIGGCAMWLRGLPYRQQLRAIEAWVTQIVGRYKGQILAWETVNEMHNWTFADPFRWSHAQFLEVTRLVNDLVGALDPGTPRVINNCLIWGDYAQKQPGMWTPVRYLDEVIQAGIPFEGIGLQYYNPGRDLLECLLQMDAFAAFGKSLWITEMGTPSDSRPLQRKETMEIPPSAVDPMLGWRGPYTPEGQADWIELWYTLASSRPALKAINWWDFTDSQAFVAHAGLLNMDGTPKLSYSRLQAWCKKYGFGKQSRVSAESRQG